MKRHAQIIPDLGRALLAGTAAVSLTLAPSIGLAGGHAMKFAQAKTEKAEPANPDAKKDKDDEKAEPRRGAPHRAPPKAAQPAGKPDAAPPPKAAAPSAPAAQRNEPAKPDRKAEPKPEPKAAPQQPAQQAPAKPAAPSTAQPKPVEPATRQSGPAQSAPGKPAPAAAQDAAKQASPEAIAPPTSARSSREFIQKKGEQPAAGLDAVRRERHESREGNRTVIREPDRTIVRDNNRTIIRHNEATRFAIDARGVHVERKGGNTTTIVTRPNGVRIVTTTDARGNLLRRVRQMPNGNSIVIIDNTFAGAPPGHFVDVPPPRFQGPRDRYIIDAGRVRRDRIDEIFIAPPIARIDRRYTLDQVRYSEPLRSYMPRVDLDINFATGSWQLTPDQVDKLSIIADGLQRAIRRNPREVFLIEGHTDAVGSDIDNLSLSDRRAEAVAVALTERFDVPPENLVTQGYGEEYPKVETGGASQANRRVAVRRITPLIDQQAASR